MAKSNKLNITPLGDRVLIKSVKENGKEKKSASGIILPSSLGEDKVDRGQVVAVGEGRIDNQGNLISPKVKVGDNVVFQWGDTISIDGQEYFIVSESSILAITK